MLGCDVFIPGMKAFKGVSAIRIALSEDRACEDTLFASLHKQFMDNNNLSKQDVDTYIDAIVYEPTNPIPESTKSPTGGTTSIERTYLVDHPTTLPRYLEQYSIDDTFKCDNIFDGPSTLFCKGVGEQKHIFLAHEGHANCHHCKEVVCSYCQGSIGDNIFCLSCLATETIVPAHGSIEDKTILEMRAVELTSNDMSGYINPTVRMTARLGLEIGNASSFGVDGRNFSMPILSGY